jgi:Na+/proline symporter
VLLSLGSLVAEDLLGRPRRDASTTALGKRVAAWVMLAMACGALFREITLWRLIELKMELLIQCVPAFLLALHWRGLRARPALVGLAAGTVVAIAGVLLGWKRVGGIHIGMLSLALNLSIAVAGSWLARGAPAEPSFGSARPRGRGR